MEGQGRKWKKRAVRVKGSGSFPRVRFGPAARSDVHGALSQRFDLPTESLGAPWFLQLRMPAQRIGAVYVHSGEQAAICVSHLLQARGKQRAR